MINCTLEKDYYKAKQAAANTTVKTLRFSKNRKKEWFLSHVFLKNDLKINTQPFDDLKMIKGFDTFLDWIAEDQTEILLKFNTQQFHDDCRPFYKSDRDGGKGCYYFYAATDYISDHWGVWFSPIFKTLFEDWPNVFYFKKA